MSTYILVEIAGDGSVNATGLTDPITVTEPVDIPLASLFPKPVEPQPADAGAPAPGPNA